MTATSGEPGPTDHVATFVPDHVVDRARYLRHVGPLDGRCLHEERQAHGVWVCLRPAGHDGRHG